MIRSPEVCDPTPTLTILSSTGVEVPDHLNVCPLVRLDRTLVTMFPFGTGTMFLPSWDGVSTDAHRLVGLIDLTKYFNVWDLDLATPSRDP